MVVVTALIEWRNLTFLSLEEPLHSLAGSGDVDHVVLGIADALTLLNLEAVLGGVLLHGLEGLVLAYELRELVVGRAIG